MSGIAIIVTCHQPYLRWLPAALELIDRQQPQPAERVVVFDGCAPIPVPGDQWRYVRGEWGHPAGARNAGLAATSAPWAVFWDADNAMPPGYLAALRRAIATAPPNVGIIYPDIQYCDEQLRPHTFWPQPEWDYWSLRAENCIDTASAWRRAAMEIAGGWSERGGGFEDYALALDITALGWRAQKLYGPAILMRVHARSRLQEQRDAGRVLTDLWRSRSLAIVSLLAGREDTFERWVAFLLTAELPPHTSLYVMENSGRPDFSRRAFDACYRIATERSLVRVSFASQPASYHATPDESYFTPGRHLHVARLYAATLPRVGEDLILTLEDDVEPPPDAARRLGEAIGYRTRGNVGAIGAAYAMPYNENEVCAGAGDRATNGWGGRIGWDQLGPEEVDVASIGGGCTVWANWALQGEPLRITQDRRFWLGWDGTLCHALRQKGYRLRLHGGVRCEHHVHGRLARG